MLAIARTAPCPARSPGANAAADGARFVTFDPPGSTFTVPSGITPEGVITGYYTDGSGVTHGFLRARNGSFTTFDPPGSVLTQPTSINPAGQIAGAYSDTAACTPEHGFVRASNGTFTTFDAPGGSSNISPGLFNPGGPPPSISPAGAIAGTYSVTVPSFTEHGFLRTPDGTITKIDIAGCGVRGGNLPFAINPAGASTGVYSDATCNVSHGFLRAPNGAVTTFDAPGCTSCISPYAINSAGAVVGNFFTSAVHGFLRTPDGAITVFDPPGSFGTFPFEINPAGVIIGSYLDASFVPHGFLRSP